VQAIYYELEVTATTARDSAGVTMNDDLVKEVTVHVRWEDRGKKELRATTNLYKLP
jgi:hypothetical protein